MFNSSKFDVVKQNYKYSILFGIYGYNKVCFVYELASRNYKITE